ncbi:homoprotocatechuate degradation operon regulator HpaR [Shimia biformata]|uniref:homoprotocatechuate degradation operon regulator HpaR n=1 Tax=Shimia biformata TaxID=1294299 RepID=UPI00195287B3|nr:homoprotocatechuate degradation operon regulator HpaR [Shimia biformata]
MTVSDEKYATSQSLPIVLLRARERVMGPLRNMLADADVTEQQWRVLRVLDEEGALDPTTIADHAVLLLPSLTRILQKLEEKGFVTRARDQEDRRRQIIEITATGRALLAENLDQSRTILDEFRAKMGAGQYDELLTLLNELCRLED